MKMEPQSTAQEDTPIAADLILSGFEILYSPRRGDNRVDQLNAFSVSMILIQDSVGFKLSARGWCYILEGMNLINKSQFDKVEKIINECRKGGYLPIDFTAQNDNRRIDGFNEFSADTYSRPEFVCLYLRGLRELHEEWSINYWEFEDYYPIIVVEKIDLKTLFKPICDKYHIPITNASGWSDINQRANLTNIFKYAESKSLDPVLLYCGDFDPIGLDMSYKIRSNLREIFGGSKYDPEKLIINRFGLNYDFIQGQNLTWIDNLISGSGRDMTKPTKQGRVDPRVVEYVEAYGKRKCEANAIIVRPRAGRQLCENAVLKYLKPEAEERFKALDEKNEIEFKQFFKESGLEDTITRILNQDKEEEE